MRARYACSICLERARLFPLALSYLIAGCNGPGKGAPTSSASGGAPATTAPPNQAPAAGVQTPPKATSPALSAATPELRVQSCSPCTFSATSAVTFEILFQPRASDQEVVELEIKAPGMPGSSQRLPVENGWSPSNEFLLRAVDLDFDGVLDVGFGPVLGTPNLALGYWLVDVNGGTWRSAGLLSNLRIDAGARELVTTEKGGHAGMLLEEKVYRWHGQKLELVRSVEQVALEGKPGYRKIARTFAGGKQVIEKVEDLLAPPATELRKVE